MDDVLVIHVGDTAIVQYGIGTSAAAPAVGIGALRLQDPKAKMKSSAPCRWKATIDVGGAARNTGRSLFGEMAVRVPR
jgi:hypothetical protein